MVKSAIRQQRRCDVILTLQNVVAAGAVGAVGAGGVGGAGDVRGG